MDKRTHVKTEEDEKEYGIGPVKGFMTYASNMGMQVQLNDKVVILTMQGGTCGLMHTSGEPF